MADPEVPTIEPTPTPEIPIPPSAADLLYGTGEVEPTPEPEAITPEPEKPEIENPENLAVTPEVEPEPIVADPPVEEEETISTVDELTAHYDLDPDWFKTLKIPTKVNGQMGEVSIADALAATQQSQAADMYLSDAKTRSKQMLEDANKVTVDANEKLVVGAKLLEQIESQLNTERDSADLQRLRVDDPAEYAALVADQGKKRTALESMKRTAAEAFRQSQTNSQQQVEQALQQALPAETELFESVITDFTDAERDNVPVYMKAQGFSDQDIRMLGYNGKALGIAVKAMRHDASKGKKKTAQKKVQKIPKVLKPGPKPAETKTPASDDRATILYGSN